MAALITAAQLEATITAARVVDLCDDDGDGVADPATVSEVIEQASDTVQEYAVEVGDALTVGTMTAAMRRRVAIIAAHYAGSRRPEFRDANGAAPYLAEYKVAIAELEAWAKRTRDISSGAPEDEDAVLCVTNASRRWQRR